MTHRLSHIAEVLEFLGQGVRKFMESWEESSKAAQGSSVEKIAQLKEQLSNLPEYQDLKAKVCMKQFFLMSLVLLI